MRFAFFVSLKNVELDHFFTIKSHGHYKANATQSIIGLILTNLLRYSLTEQVFMITISDTAQAHFVKLLADQPEGTHIRVFVISPGTAQAECLIVHPMLLKLMMLNCLLMALAPWLMKKARHF